ncbi:hypothetical protein SF293071_5086 [Shigella flexneri 2930-71]|nr:hypothetical protein SF293071_5086 [Shigella flexneri 2930-71]KDZ21560.1 hypothetical protein AB43_4501 [Escherichia coli 3-020-07_S1_C2]KDZ23247.1 hypothetical protein AB15_2138 [Escherichia coli 3-020-07_S1_C1]
MFFYGSAVSRNVVQGEKLLPRFALPFLIFSVKNLPSE